MTVQTTHGMTTLPDNFSGRFEMVQNFDLWPWSDREVLSRLNRKMVSAYGNVLSTSRQFGINMRQAAYVVSFRRLIDAMRLRGWVR